MLRGCVVGLLKAPQLIRIRGGRLWISKLGTGLLNLISTEQYSPVWYYERIHYKREPLIEAAGTTYFYCGIWLANWVTCTSEIILGRKMTIIKNMIKKTKMVILTKRMTVFLYRCLWHFGFLGPVGTSCFESQGGGPLSPALIYSQWVGWTP